MGLKTILAAMALGYFLASIHLPLSWFLIMSATAYALLDRFFISTSLSYRQLLLQQQQSQAMTKRLKNNRRYDANNTNKNGISCLNNVIETMWKGWEAEGVLTFVNSWLAQNKPMKGIMDSVILSSIDLGNEVPPIITMIQCIEHSQQKTVIEAHFEYTGPFFVEWSMKPTVLPFNLRCMLHSISVFGKVRIDIHYAPVVSTEDNPSLSDLRISKVEVALSEYPEIDGNVQMFDSLDLTTISNTIPSLTQTLRKRFRETLMLTVYPSTIVIYSSGDESRDAKPLHKTSRDVQRKLQMGFDNSDIADLEDELRNNLLDINQLLKLTKANTTEKSSEVVKKEVCESVFSFLKVGQEPGRIPVSMMDTVKRGFGILNSLAFGEEDNDSILTTIANTVSTKKEVDEQVLDIIMRSDNMSFIGEVARTCSLADDLVRNIMRIQDRRIRSRVNHVLNELNIQDVPLVVMNRARTNS